MTQKVTFMTSMDRLTRNVEIRSSTGRRVADVKAMASDVMTLTYADIMCTALNAVNNADASVLSADPSPPGQ